MSLILAFLYIIVISPIVNPPRRHVLVNNETIDIPAQSYESIKFDVPSTFGAESIEMQFRVEGNASTVGERGEEEMDVRGINVYVSDNLGRFECERSNASADGPGGSQPADCSQLITIIESQVANSTSGELNGPIREGQFYLVLDNIASSSATRVTVSLAVVTQ